MPPLVRRQPKQHAAPQVAVPWYEPTVAYLLVMPGVLVWFVGIPVLISYWECTGAGNFRCSLNGELLQPTSGQYGGIVAAAAICLGLSLLGAALVQLLVRKLHFLLVWAIAALASTASIVGYMVIAGYIGTPWGQLLPA